MIWRRYVAIAAAGLAVACTGSARPAASRGSDRTPVATRAVLFGFATYGEPNGDFEASRLVRLDPTSLQVQPFSSLKLGDATDAHVFSPDRSQLALGGVNFGEIVVVDLVRYGVAEQVAVVPAAGGRSEPVSPIAWPRPDRLLAYAEPTAAHASFPARLFLVDPVADRVVRSEPLGGSVIATSTLADGRAALLLGPPDRVGAARLVVADAAGGTRTIVLPGTAAGFGEHDEEPALAVAGDTVYVVGNDDRIAQVDVTTGAVRYHEVRGLLSQRIPSGAPLEPGSGGLLWRDYRNVESVGGGLLAVSGGDTRPVLRATKNQESLLSAQIVDTGTWTVRRTLRGVGQVVAAHGLYYCWVAGSDFNNMSLVALRRNGAVAFRLTTPQTVWSLMAGRLIAHPANADATGAEELDPLTGRVLHTIPSFEVSELLPWPAEVKQ